MCTLRPSPIELETERDIYLSGKATRVAVKATAAARARGTGRSTTLAGGRRRCFFVVGGGLLLRDLTWVRASVPKVAGRR
jgi:hypothetical protein